MNLIGSTIIMGNLCLGIQYILHILNLACSLRYSNSQYSSDNNNKKVANRFPIELFQKNESNLNSSHINNAATINQQTTLLNSYRIRSAQNAAKQRATGKSSLQH